VVVLDRMIGHLQEECNKEGIDEESYYFTIEER
jgi:hypothetical protein